MIQYNTRADDIPNYASDTINIKFIIRHTSTLFSITIDISNLRELTCIQLIQGRLPVGQK